MKWNVFCSSLYSFLLSVSTGDTGDGKLKIGFMHKVDCWMLQSAIGVIHLNRISSLRYLKIPRTLMCYLEDQT